VASVTLTQSSSADGPTGPLFLQLHAGGGWDPTLFCDPRPEVNGVAFTEATTAPTTQGQVFRYANLGGSSAPIPKDIGYNFGTFFETYRNELLLINGLYTQSVGHRSGARFAASGRIAAGYPALGALLAAEQGSEMAMPLLVMDGGGYSETRGHVTPTRLTSNAAIGDLAYPNLYASGNEQFYTDDEHDLLIDARAARLQRLLDSDPRTSDRRSMEDLAWARSKSGQLEALVSAIDTGPNIAVPPSNSNNAAARRIFFSGFMVLLAYEQGLTRAGSMAGGSFDTHTKHDILHPNQLQNVLLGVDLLMQEAALRNIDLVLLITSEFGRTAEYNVADGKDHWPVTSWMLLQSPGLDVITPGRTVGATSYEPTVKQILAHDLDPTTLEVGSTAGDALLTPGMCHVGLRQRLGLDETMLADHQYPLVGPDVSKVFTG